MFAVRVSDSPKPPALDEDADVAGERARICTNQKTNEILRIQDLSKVKRFSFRNVTDNGNQVKKKNTPKRFVQVEMFLLGRRTKER